MRFGTNLVLLTFTFMITLFYVVPDLMASDPVELESLRASFNILKTKLVNNYIEELTSLERFMLSNNNSAGAEAVHQELDRATRELPPVVIAPLPVAPPAPQPVVRQHEPQTHVSSVKGIAGAASFSENNIYTFNLVDVGRTSTLVFWATGRRSVETIGNVWLITPDGRREKVSKWRDRDFEEPASEISSYKELKPVTEDISGLVVTPGVYKVEFEWTGGIDPLVIFRVELTS